MSDFVPFLDTYLFKDVRFWPWKVPTPILYPQNPTCTSFFSTWNTDSLTDTYTFKKIQLIAKWLIDLKIFANSRPTTSESFLTVSRQNNFGNKILLIFPPPPLFFPWHIGRPIFADIPTYLVQFCVLFCLRYLPVQKSDVLYERSLKISKYLPNSLNILTTLHNKYNMCQE